MLDTNLYADYSYGVYFLAGGAIPNVLSVDTHFQSVSGISSTISTKSVNEGGQNLYSHRLPDRVGYENLKLTRGLVIGSIINVEFNLAMSALSFSPCNVLVTLLDSNGLPILGANWLFNKAYPVSWSTSELSGKSNDVVIDSMELAYTRFQSIRF